MPCLQAASHARKRQASIGHLSVRRDRKDLDRFSTFRLPGRPTGYEWEAMSLPIMPAAQFNELFPQNYGIASVTYRYEAMFFPYPT